MEKLKNNKNLTSLKELVNILNENDYFIFNNYLNGMSQQEIGNIFNLSKQTISKKLKQILYRLPRLKEDSYLYFFEKYNFTEKYFLKIFESEKYVYRYLNLRYSKGKECINNIVDDPFLKKKEKNIVNNLFNKNTININNEIVILEKLHLIKYIIKNYKETLDEEILFKEYSNLLKKYSLNTKEYSYSKKYFKKIILNFKDIICERNIKFRYYDIDSIQVDELIKNLNLISFSNQNIIISTKLLFENHLKLMEKIDIRNYYELHNLLRKKITNPGWYNLKFSRMPNIIFGNISTQEQIFKFFKISTQIFSSVDEFCSQYEKVYGINSLSLKQSNYKLIRNLIYKNSIGG